MALFGLSVIAWPFHWIGAASCKPQKRSESYNPVKPRSELVKPSTQNIGSRACKDCCCLATPLGEGQGQKRSCHPGTKTTQDVRQRNRSHPLGQKNALGKMAQGTKEALNSAGAVKKLNHGLASWVRRAYENGWSTESAIASTGSYCKHLG